MKYLQPEWPAPAHIKAFTTIRHSWGEYHPYHEKTTGHFSGHLKQSLMESKQFKEQFQLPVEPLWITQVHSAIAIEARPENREKVADATFSNQPNQVCVVVTADCLPILICNKQGTHVAAIHAGWRGLANGIIETTLAALKLPSEDLLVWLGPAIGPQKFEVGNDVYDAFVNKHEKARVAFVPQQDGKWLANLYTLATLRLTSKGVHAIYGGNFCTYSQADMFFSYRRDGRLTGRMASVIWRDQKTQE